MQIKINHEHSVDDAKSHISKLIQDNTYLNIILGG